MAVEPIEILRSLRQCLLGSENKVIPIFAGASFRNIGVQPLLDSVVNLLPSPKERPDPDVSIGSITGGLSSLLRGEFAVEDNCKPAKHKQKKKSVGQCSGLQAAIQMLEGCALAFKVVNDAKRGILVYVRVYAGSINRNASLFNTNLNVAERAPQLLKMYASDSIEVQSIPAGQIGVIVGLKYARTGDTLLSCPGNKRPPPGPLNTLQLRPIEVPPPVFFASIEPHSLSEEKHLHEALALLLREDPSLHVNTDNDSGQTLLSGMGELHLEIARDRLVNDFKVKASMGQIEIGYRECVTNTSSLVTRVFDKEIAGRRGKAGCAALVQPFDPESYSITSRIALPENAVFTEDRDGNRITILASGIAPGNENTALPSHLSLASIKTSLYNGCFAALARGPQHSFPIRSTHVTLVFDLTQHLFGGDTTPSALSSAARLATQTALKEVAATSTLMEPVMNVTISVQESNLGAVVHDISASRGGHIVSLDDGDVFPSTSDLPVIDTTKIYAPPDPFGPSSPKDIAITALNQSRTVTAKVPLKEMVGYLKHLRSLTGGRGTFVMSVDRFERMGSQREKAVLAAVRGI
jgi:elongation factor G